MTNGNGSRIYCLAKPPIVGDSEGQPSVSRGRAVDCADGQSVGRLGSDVRELACDIYALLTLGQERRVAADHLGDPHGRRFGSAAHRQHDRTGPPACSWRPKKDGPQALGRSRGGLSTKIHTAVDALGNPLRFRLTAGQVSDIQEAQALIEGFETQAVIGDKGYDADALVARIEASGAQAVIPPRKNRTEQRSYDHHLYEDRNLVERFFNRLKQFRRIATRYEKLARNFSSMISLVFTYLWLA